jgi:hypothetical protein
VAGDTAAGIRTAGLRAAAAHLGDRPPLPPEDFKDAASCGRDVAEVKRCFDAIDGWQRSVGSWLASHGLDASDGLPHMPLFDTARSDLARDLSRSIAGAYAASAGLDADGDGNAELRISFDQPVSQAYVTELIDDLDAENVDGMRGTFAGATTITAGYDAGDSDLRTQVTQFYRQQLRATSTILAGLRSDLETDVTAAQRSATRAEIENVERFRSTLDHGNAFISAVTVHGDQHAILDARSGSGSAIQAVEVLAADNQPDAAGAPQPGTVVAAESGDGAASARTASVRAATVREASGGPVARVARTSPRSYAPNRWNLRTTAEHTTDSPYVKYTYLGFKWTQRGALDWYQGDDHHDRGFEAQAHPYDGGGGLWSTNWWKTRPQGDIDTRGRCPDTRPGCNGMWNSNMPDAYRDDLSSDGKYKSFAIGSADAKSLDYNTPYFAWYLTNEGESAGGKVSTEAQATRRPKWNHPEERGYCLSHGDTDSACFFAEATKWIANYPIENRYHKYVRSW